MDRSPFHISLTGGLAGHRFTRIERYVSLPPSLLGLSQEWSLIDLPLRASSDHSFIVWALRARRAPDRSFPPLLPVLFFLHLLKRGEANRPSLRASSDHRYIVGALRARRMV